MNDNKPDINAQEPSSPPNSLGTVTRYLKRYRGYLAAGGVAVVMTNILMLYVPYLTKMVFDTLEEKGDLSKILNYVLLIIVLSLVAGVFRFVMRRTIIWMSRHIEYDLRGDLLKHLLKLSPSFYHSNRTGDIMARMTNDLEAVRQMIGPGIMYISDSLIKLLIAFSVMIYMSAELTLYAVAPLVILPVAVNLVANALHRRSMKVQEHFSVLTAAAQENLSGIRVVKAYRQETAEIGTFLEHSRKYIRLNMSLAKLHGVFFPTMRFVAALSYLSVFYFGGLQVIDGSISLGTMVAFFAYLSIILWPIIALGWVMSLYQRGRASLERIDKILKRSPEISDIVEKPHSERLQGRIEFRNMRFSYNGVEVLKGIDLTIEAGQTVGIIGFTGSGKTTLVSLLARLYPVQRGQLFIDGVDINDWKLELLRRQIGFATQEPFLFSDTIGENILFGCDMSDPAHLEKAAQTAALTGDISGFANGFDTIVGERGITLSGGQKQRTTIARALVVDPAILILDDATSAVDTETEHEINNRIKEVLPGKTAIIISHRVSAVKDADMILYFENGRIHERGSHEQLIESGGAYASLYRSQLLQVELDELK